MISLFSSSALSGESTPFRLADQGPKFTYTDGPRGTLHFTRVVQFTPDGTARVLPSAANALQIILVPVKGDPAHGRPDAVNAAAVRVAGLTGQVKIYRP